MLINNQRGVSITELMLSLSLSCLMMTALLQHYIGVKRHYEDVQQQLDEHFDLQLVNELIRDTVRHAGFTPCVGINRLQIRDNRSEKFSAAITIEGGASQAVRIARMSEQFVVVLKQLSPTRFLVEGNKVFDRRYPIVIADCFHAEVLQVSSSITIPAGHILTLKTPVTFDYDPPVYVGEWLEERFYIGKNRLGIPALFYEANAREELTSHINKLTASLIPIKGNLLLQITLRFVKGKSLLLETMVRTPQTSLTVLAPQ